jgi:hypothetical protein
VAARLSPDGAVTLHLRPGFWVLQLEEERPGEGACRQSSPPAVKDRRRAELDVTVHANEIKRFRLAADERGDITLAFNGHR